MTGRTIGPQQEGAGPAQSSPLRLALAQTIGCPRDQHVKDREDGSGPHLVINHTSNQNHALSRRFDNCHTYTKPGQYEHIRRSPGSCIGTADCVGSTLPVHLTTVAVPRLHSLG